MTKRTTEVNRLPRFLPIKVKEVENRTTLLPSLLKVRRRKGMTFVFQEDVKIKTTFQLSTGKTIFGLDRGFVNFYRL